MEKEMKKMEQIIHMKGGTGEASYANNSISQNGYLSMSMGTLEQAAVELCSSNNLPQSVAIADLGCSSGPNSLVAVTNITSIIYKRCSQLGRSPPEFSVFLNDLVGNDFNTVFKSLPTFHDKMQREFGPDFGPCYFAAAPGSFYGRLFPSRSLHFVHSSSSVHWLSQVPPELTREERPLLNKGKIFISKTSSVNVINAYFNQFQKDFSEFLRCRSKEIVPGGRMMLLFRGRRTQDPSPDESCLLWDYLGQAFQELVQEGLIEEGKLDSYNTPYYEPYMEDVRGEIEKEGSFIVDRLETVQLPWDGVNGGKSYDRAKTAQLMGKAIRAVNESMFRSHFGGEILDSLFQKFSRIMAADTREVEHVSVAVSVIRNA